MSRPSASNEAAPGAADGTAAVRGVLAGLSLCMLLPSLGTSIANVALPAFAEAFSASFQQVQWIVLAYLLANTTLIVSVGRLGDVLGRRRLLEAGLLVFTAASVLCGLAPTLPLLLAARALQGAGAAALMALTLSFVNGTVPRRDAGKAMGLLGTTSAIGTALGPSLGGLLLDALGWPALFLINVPLGLLALWLVRRFLPADGTAPRADQPRFDLPGTLLLAATLGAYALAMTTGRGRFGLLNGSLLLATVAGLALFLRVEAKAASPLIRPGLLREPVLASGLAMSALVSSVVMATLVVGPFYLGRVLGLAAAGVGLVLSAGPAAAALAGVPAGRLVDRHGARRMSLAGLGGMGAGCLALSLVPAAWGVAGFVLPVVAVTASYALFQAANNTGVMGEADAQRRGVVSGLLGLSRSLGLITGASLMGGIFALAAGTVDFAAAPAQAVSAGLRATFLAATVLVGVALLVAVASRARRGEAAPQGSA